MRFLVIQHLVVESFGIFGSLCDAAGIECDVVQVERGDRFPEDLSIYDALWVMGGPMNVDQEEKHGWLKAEKALIRRAVQDQGMAYLGVCLGAQLLAEALGGQVGPMAGQEVGVLPISLTPIGQESSLLKGLPFTLPVLQWHGYEVKQLPPGGQILAVSDACGVQAFGVENRAFGLQFHPEVTDTVMHTWLSVDAYCADLRSTLGPDGCTLMQVAVTTHLDVFAAHAHLLFNNFLSIVERCKARQAVDPGLMPSASPAAGA